MAERVHGGDRTTLLYVGCILELACVMCHVKSNKRVIVFMQNRFYKWIILVEFFMLSRKSLLTFYHNKVLRDIVNPIYDP